jgi:hypothetical protein
MASIASALPRIPPVTSGPAPVGRSRSTTSRVTSGIASRRPRPRGSRMPGTSLTKITRAIGIARTRATAIVSALRIDQPHCRSGTTSPKATGTSPPLRKAENGWRSIRSRRPASFQASGAGGTEPGFSPARTSSRRTARWRRRTSAATIAAPRARSRSVAPSTPGWARPKRWAPGWPNEPAPWRTINGTPVASPSSSARRRSTFGRRCSTSFFRVMTLPPSFTRTGAGAAIAATRVRRGPGPRAC